MLKVLIIIFGLGYLLYAAVRFALHFFVGYYTKDMRRQAHRRTSSELNIDYVPPKGRTYRGGEYIDYEEVGK